MGLHMGSGTVCNYALKQAPIPRCLFLVTLIYRKNRILIQKINDLSP